MLRTAAGETLRYRDVARDYQDRLLADRSPRVIVAKSRQIGVSQAVAFRVAWEALRGGTAIVISRNGDQAVRFLRYVAVAVSQAPHPPLVRDNLTALAFANGGSVEVQAATKGAGRGIPATLVVLDEMAWMEYGDDIYTAVTPTLAETGGDLILLSSANGRATLFFRLWQAAQSLGGGWSPHFLPWSVHPEWSRDPAWPRHKMEADNLTAEAFAQEYGVDFLVSGGAVFDPATIAAMWRMPALMPPVAGHRYLTAWDIARKRDAFVGFTLDISVAPFAVVAYERHLGLDYPRQAERIEARAAAYPGETWVESNGVGDPLIQFLAIPVREFVTTALSKRNALDALRLLIDRGEIEAPRLPDWERELLLYQFADAALQQDTVMASAIAAYAAGRPRRRLKVY